MSTELVVAAIQMTSVDDVDSNLAQMKFLLEEAFKHESPRLVSFPENCLYLRLNEGEKIEGMTVNYSRGVILECCQRIIKKP